MTLEFEKSWLKKSEHMARVFVFTLDRQSNERIVTGGEPPVGEDRSVDPGEEGREAGVHVR